MSKLDEVPNGAQFAHNPVSHVSIVPLLTARIIIQLRLDFSDLRVNSAESPAILFTTPLSGIMVFQHLAMQLFFEFVQSLF